MAFRERTLSKSDILGSGPSSFAFSNNGTIYSSFLSYYNCRAIGRIVSMGSEDGSIALLDLESSNYVTTSP